jgi:hypothetical protein
MVNLAHEFALSCYVKFLPHSHNQMWKKKKDFFILCPLGVPFWYAEKWRPKANEKRQWATRTSLAASWFEKKNELKWTEEFKKTKN